MTEVLIIGASGLLGQHLLNEAEARRNSVTGTYYSEEVAGLERMDLTDFDMVKTMIAERRPDIVILPAAMTSISDCESNPMKAMMVNSEAPLVVAKACSSIGAKMAFFSTVHVFDCESGPYAEDSRTNPINIFGRTRLEGERNVMQTLPDSLVIRTCEDFGWNRLRQRENIVTGLIHRMRCGEEVTVTTNQTATPSYAAEVADIVFRLLDGNASGIYHVGTRSGLSMFEIGTRVAQAFRLPETLLKPRVLHQKGLGVPEPANLCMNVGKVECQLNMKLSILDSCLSHMNGESVST